MKIIVLKDITFLGIVFVIVCAIFISQAKFNKGEKKINPTTNFTFK